MTEVGGDAVAVEADALLVLRAVRGDRLDRGVGSEFEVV